MNVIGQQHNKQLENVKSTINFTTKGLQTNVTLNVIGVKKKHQQLGKQIYALLSCFES